MDNLQGCFESLYKAANHKVKNFDNIALVDSALKGVDYNLIFNLEPSSTRSEDEKSLKMAFSAANETLNPFLFLQDKDINYKIDDLLNQYKFAHVGQVNYLSIDHSSYKLQHNESQEFEVIQVKNDNRLNDWSNIIDESFHMVTGNTKSVFGPAISYLFGGKSKHNLFILYDQEQTPISASLLYLPEDNNLEAGHYCWATRAEHRNKGAMSFLVREMLSIASNKGFKTSVAQCHAEALKLAKNIGFKSKGFLDIFSNASCG